MPIKLFFLVCGVFGFLSGAAFVTSGSKYPYAVLTQIYITDFSWTLNYLEGINTSCITFENEEYYHIQMGTNGSFQLIII